MVITIYYHTIVTIILWSSLSYYHIILLLFLYDYYFILFYTILYYFILFYIILCGSKLHMWVKPHMWVNVDGLMRVRVWFYVGWSRWHMYMSAWCRGVEVAYVGQCRMHGFACMGQI